MRHRFLVLVYEKFHTGRRIYPSTDDTRFRTVIQNENLEPITKIAGRPYVGSSGEMELHAAKIGIAYSASKK